VIGQLDVEVPHSRHTAFRVARCPAPHLKRYEASPLINYVNTTLQPHPVKYTRTDGDDSGNWWHGGGVLCWRYRCVYHPAGFVARIPVWPYDYYWLDFLGFYREHLTVYKQKAQEAFALPAPFTIHAEIVMVLQHACYIKNRRSEKIVAAGEGVGGNKKLAVRFDNLCLGEQSVPIPVQIRHNLPRIHVSVPVDI
jgi:hypothetical protein